MFKLIVKGEASTNYKKLVDLNGVKCQDNFALGFGNTDFSFKENIKDGYMSFIFENNKLYTITEYISDRELSNEECIKLKKYTQGQWSDGIGEGFVQNPVKIKNRYVYISPWFFRQDVEITQTSL